MQYGNGSGCGLPNFLCDIMISRYDMVVDGFVLCYVNVLEIWHFYFLILIFERRCFRMDEKCEHITIQK